MDLRQLTYLVTVVDTGGFRAAARHLQVAQPSVSNALRALEAELGVALLRRGPRGVEPTDAGAELVAHGRDLIAGFGTAREAVQRVAERQRGTLRVGLVTGIVSAGELLPPILDAYHEDRPDLDLQLDDVSFADQVTPLLEGHVDVMIARGPFEQGPLAHRELEIVPIAEEPRVLLVARSHELAAEAHVSVVDILHLPTLPLSPPVAWSGFWQLDDLRGGSIADRQITPVSTIPQVHCWVASRDVVVSTPGAVARFAPNPLLSAVPLDGAPRSVIGVAHRRCDRRGAVRRFIAAAQRAAAQHLHLMPSAVLPG